MDQKRSTRLLLPCLAALLVAAPGACKKDGSTSQPPPASQSEQAEPEIDPRLAGEADKSGGESGGAPAASDPHGGAAQGGAAANPHGATPPGGMGGGGGGREPEKTADGRVILGPVTAAVPASWQSKPTTSGMRAAQWTIPGKGGEAELVVYYFGAGGAGGAEANLDRWIKQFEQPDGSSSADKAKIEKKTVSGMATTFVEVTGRYVAAVMPGAAEQHNSPDYMMLGAIVETSAGPYYFKLVGPEATVTGVKKDFRGFVESMTPGGK